MDPPRPGQPIVSTAVPDIWTITKQKITGESRSWQAYLLGEDKYGTWFYAPAGTANRDRSGKLINHLAMDGVQLIPVDDWWVAWWWLDDGITVDIATPAERGANTAAYVDLELDLWASGDDHGLVDQDEYDAARVAGLISDEQDGNAVAAAKVVDRMLAEQNEPFAGVGRQLLQHARLSAR